RGTRGYARGKAPYAAHRYPGAAPHVDVDYPIDYPGEPCTGSRLNTDNPPMPKRSGIITQRSIFPWRGAYRDYVGFMCHAPAGSEAKHRTWSPSCGSMTPMR